VLLIADALILISLTVKIYHRNVSPGQLIMAKSPEDLEARPELIATPDSRPGPEGVYAADREWQEGGQMRTHLRMKTLNKSYLRVTDRLII
jgi:hypothetical protein